MLYYTNSKVYQNIFLRHESYQDILKSQYVLVSTRISSSGEYENIVQARNMLYPNPEVCSTIEEKYNIIFMNTYKEEKNMKFLEYLSEFIFIHFGYPCYNYKYYSLGMISLIKYNKKDVLKICNEYLKEAKDNYNNDKNNKLKEFKKMSKKKLRKILQKEGLYMDGMDKEEILESIKLFL